MLKHFCVACVGLSMMSFFATTPVRAIDDSSTLKGEDDREPRFQLTYEQELSYTTCDKLISFSQGKFQEMNQRPLTDKESFFLSVACRDSVQLLDLLFIAKKKKQDHREPTREEIEENCKQIDENLRSRICNGDFELDMTKVLQREGYEGVSWKDRYKKK